MELKAKLQEDMKTALKAHDSVRLGTVRMLISEVKKKEIDTKTQLDQETIEKHIKSMIKQRHDSIDAFTKGNRMDLADKEKAEIAILTAYLPQQLSKEETEKLVTEAIAESGATGPADIGKVMKAALAKAQGKADGKMINEIARTKLTP